MIAGATLALTAVACLGAGWAVMVARGARDEARSAARAAARAVGRPVTPAVPVALSSDDDASTDVLRRPVPVSADATAELRVPAGLGGDLSTVAASALGGRSMDELAARPGWQVVAEDGEQVEEAPAEGGGVRMRVCWLGHVPAPPWTVVAAEELAAWRRRTGR